MNQVKVKYCFTKNLKDISYKNAVQKVINVLKEHGFSIICNIDMKKNIQNSLNLYFNNYTILGVYYPNLAYKALKAESNIGPFIINNVIIYERENGISVGIINPESYEQVIENSEIKPIIQEIKGKLMQIPEDL